MRTSTFKNTALLLLCLSTALLILDSIHIRMVDTTETGLLDFLPEPFIAILFFAYPVFLLGSLVFFLMGRKARTKTDLIYLLLFLLNGIAASYMLAGWLGH